MWNAECRSWLDMLCGERRRTVIARVAAPPAVSQSLLTSAATEIRGACGGIFLILYFIIFASFWQCDSHSLCALDLDKLGIANKL